MLLKNFKNGANVTIECFHRVLQDLDKSKKGIPRVIYLQLDNTTKQNKNRYIIGYCACLVQWGLADKVVVSFLPVGHTHEDVGMQSFVFCCGVRISFLFITQFLF